MKGGHDNVSPSERQRHSLLGWPPGSFPTSHTPSFTFTPSSFTFFTLPFPALPSLVSPLNTHCPFWQKWGLQHQHHPKPLLGLGLGLVLVLVLVLEPEPEPEPELEAGLTVTISVLRLLPSLHCLIRTSEEMAARTRLWSMAGRRSPPWWRPSTQRNTTSTLYVSTSATPTPIPLSTSPPSPNLSPSPFNSTDCVVFQHLCPDA